MADGLFLGIDTSNYTTSAAAVRGGGVFSQRRLLPVPQGALGLRQSDAVFHHVRALPEMVEKVLNPGEKITAIGVSDRPRDLEDSYMPCFIAGVSAAKMLAAAGGARLFRFSHQAGHLAAAIYSSGHNELYEAPFIAFHVSGGTTEAVLVTPDEEHILKTKPVAASLDLKAGQAIDRCGVMLSLAFPAGPELEKLALSCPDRFAYKPALRGADVSLSGIENQFRRMLEHGETPQRIARFTLEAVAAALSGMCRALISEYGEMPVLFAGGVSSCSIIRDRLSGEFGASFAKPEYSSDNAAGIALLAERKYEKEAEG